MDFEGSPNLPYVYVNSSGTIKNSKPIQVVSACSLETYAFPFDIQNCSLTFSSALHTGKLGEAQSATGRHTELGWHTRVTFGSAIRGVIVFLHIIDSLQISVSSYRPLASVVIPTKSCTVPSSPLLLVWEYNI